MARLSREAGRRIGQVVQRSEAAYVNPAVPIVTSLPIPQMRRRRFKVVDSFGTTDTTGGITVKILNSAATTGFSFEVYNPQGIFESTGGAKGMAEWWPDAQRWEIYQLYCEAVST